MQDVILFANSIAGLGRGKAIADRLAEVLAHAGYGVRAFLEPPETVSLDRVRGNASALAAISIGGDGTLRNVAERLIQAFGPEAIPPLVVVPLGTANLMARHLKIDWHGPSATAQIIAAIAQQKVVKLDAARASGQLFLLTAGAGLDGSIIHELDRIRSGPIDLASYALPIALAMQKYTFPPVTVDVDGRRLFGPRPGMVFIANAPEYGTGFSILPQAKSDDGLLDVCVLPCKNRLELLDLLLSAMAGEHLNVEGAQYTKGKQMHIAAQEPVPVQLDGEAGGFTPLDVQLLPFKVPFIVP